MLAQYGYSTELTLKRSDFIIPGSMVVEVVKFFNHGKPEFFKAFFSSCISCNFLTAIFAFTLC